ncbi:hypothetical protein K438DRAFT_1976616 [Mycena galopus ATCC 62051]|nr:hypothetical protein K438DRAFT_1976616 [Mycena galopus ATCC 62051]
MAPTHLTIGSKTLEYAVVAANALQAVSTDIPLVGRICALTLSIVPMVQHTKFQRDRCLRIVDDIHHLLSVLINFSFHSEDVQASQMLEKIAQYAVILHKVDSCLRAQQDLGTIRRLFKQSELVAQLDSCETELRVALQSFSMDMAVGISTALVEFDLDTERRHQELLELISVESGSFDLASIGRSSLNTSSGSFSLLPGEPKIFHGRESELEGIVDTLLATPARVAILGPGGMGKTTLALAALHHTRVAHKYPIRYFVSCDSAHTSDSLIATIAFNLGLDASRSLIRHVLRHLSTGPPCSVILDNFETPWEPADGRTKVEECLSLLTDVPHVALLITMRGAERPGKVQWSRPCLRPLISLPQAAARQTFLEISDDVHEDSVVDQLLDLTDNIPLAVQLIATVAASEGCQATLDRWKREGTALLSSGYDKHWNLEASIMLSLSSPRISSSTHVLELLSLMSLLSDGISDIDLVQSNPPIPDILNCKMTLVRTSLAYVDHAGRFKVLAPIRDYIQAAIPPSPPLVHALRKHFNELLKLGKTVIDRVSFLGNSTPRLISNLGNLHNILQYGLDCDPADLGETLEGIILLNQLTLKMNRGITPLWPRVSEMQAQMDDPNIHAQFIIVAFQAWQVAEVPNAEQSIEKALEYFRESKKVKEEAVLCDAVATYYLHRAGDQKKARDFYGRALALGIQTNFDMVQVHGLAGLVTVEWLQGNYRECLRLARETHKIAIAAGNIWGEVNGIRYQAFCSRTTGDLKASMKWVQKGKELIVRMGMQGGILETHLLNIEADLYQLRTEYAEARQIHKALQKCGQPQDHCSSAQSKHGMFRRSMKGSRHSTERRNDAQDCQKRRTVTLDICGIIRC